MNTGRRPAAAVGFVILFLAQASAAQNAVSGAKIFNDLCTACHTIGGGVLAGPDLLTVAHRSHDDLQKALTRMENNVGPLNPEQIEALIRLLQSPDAKAQIAAAANPPAIAIPPEQKAASAPIGRRLFYGQQPFANRAAPCFGCHTVGGRGGSLAIDLTGIYSKRSEAALLATAEQPPFPLMKATYGPHPITTQEAWHLVAFLQESSKSAATKPERTTARNEVAGGITLVVLAGVALTLRARRAGVRSRMVHK